MKLQVDKPLLDAFSRACSYTYSGSFVDKVTELFIKEALKPLILKLSKAITRISQPLAIGCGIRVNRKGKYSLPKKKKLLTLNLNPTEAFVLKFACEMYTGAEPQALEAYTIKSKFLLPINALNSR